MSATGQPTEYYDIVIVGTGLAGLTLSRQLLLYTTKSVLLIDKRVDPPKENTESRWCSAAATTFPACSISKSTC
jgi:L-2-hydroxyglutarate oxidase LhgO